MVWYFIDVYLRWLNWIFLAGYLPRWSINYIGMSKRYGKKVSTTVLYKDEKNIKTVK